VTAAAGTASGGGGASALLRGAYRLVRSLTRLIIAIFFCFTPVTAVLVLGWLTRFMAREAQVAQQRLRENGHPVSRPRLPAWFIADTSEARGIFRRWLGALADNVRAGLAALITLTAGTLPFTLLWLFSWWAGWENSFNKGYEQAWVGPVLGTIGVAISLPLLARLPMALAHQAAAGSIKSFFALAEVRQLIRAAGWRYVGLSLLYVLAALTFLVIHVAPVFIEQWRPGFSARSPEEIAAFAEAYRFWATVYVLLVLIFLRRATARLYARAHLKIESAPELTRSIGARIVAVVRALTLWLVWFALAAQIYVGQFFNHVWIGWLTHPLTLLPWLPALGNGL